MKKVFKEIYPYLIIIIVVLLVHSFLITPVRVDGDSMNTYLNDGEILLLSKVGKIKRYDIVVLHEDEDDNIIKRVYGMPGETIEIDHGKIYIEGKAIKDEYGIGETSDYAKIKLKDNEYFVLGDNREISKDSRNLGPIAKQNIKGTTIFRIFPFKKFGKI